MKKEKPAKSLTASRIVVVDVVVDDTIFFHTCQKI